MKSKKNGFTSIDEYIAACPEACKSHLRELRAAIPAAIPEAREKVSYQIGAFELNDRNLIGYAGWKNHVSIYPIPAGTKAFNEQVSKYADGKGTIKFPLDKPLSLALINQIVKFRLADQLKNIKTKSAKTY